ncbi:MAG TPA: hypothetical protein VIL18_14585 [Longimicrobiales bacterium]
MYRHCIFCLSGLGGNEALESFPVGSRIAFDASKGRLWAVCPKCMRWNLAPIEERWEPVEEAEKRFRDARLRVHSENIGLAKLPDGTRLIRVGKALPGELAAWRYGAELLRRRRRGLIVGGALGVGLVAYGGLAIAGVLGGAAGLLNLVNLGVQYRMSRKLVHRLSAEESPTGAPLELRRYQLSGARVARADGDGDVALHLPHALDPAPERRADGRVVWTPPQPLVLTGPAARRVLARAMVFANSKGASKARLDEALRLIGDAGGAEPFLRGVAGRGPNLGVPPLMEFRARVTLRRFRGALRGELVPALPMDPQTRRAARDPKARLSRPEALALEMALQEEAERRALEGELAQLEAAWREAEEIADIADRLPDDPLEGFRGR